MPNDLGLLLIRLQPLIAVLNFLVLGGVVILAFRLKRKITLLSQRQTLNEVTQNKPSEEELQYLQDQLKQQVQTMDTILSASLDHYYMFDRDGRFIYASRAGLQALGLQQTDIIGKTELELGFPQSIIEPHIQRRKTVFATGKVLKGETSVPTVDGVRHHEYILIPILDASGSVQVVVVTSRDVTERKQVEEELKQYRDRLEELVAARTTELARSNAELEQFAYVASHDLQEPLRTLVSYTKLLSRRYSGQLDTKAERFLQYIMEEALRMQALINDLLKYSQVGRQVQNFTPCESTVVFEIVVKRLAEAIRSTGATITCHNLPRIMADEMQLVQLFQNLISNAIKYRSTQPPVIEVAAEPQEGHWLFWVRDNGIGIDQKYAERIFVIFQRLHTQEEYPGTGIGLAIATKIVERHGGRIWVESELGQGSTFYFTLQKFANF